MARVRALVLIVGLAACLVAGVALAQTTSVTLTAKAPQPSVLSVTVGGAVTFVNGDTDPHVLVSSVPGIGTVTLAPGSTLVHTYPIAGAYAFREHGVAHPRGRVVVVRPATATTKTSPAKHQNPHIVATPAAHVLPFGGRAIVHGRAIAVEDGLVLQQRLPGAKTWADAHDVAPDSGGVFTLVLLPAGGASYRVASSDGKTRSRVFSFVILPRIGVVARTHAVTGACLRVTMSLHPAAAARRVELRVWDRAHHRWKVVASGAVSKSGVARAAWPVTRGRSLLRAWLGPHSPGYREASSRQIAVVGTARPAPHAAACKHHDGACKRAARARKRAAAHPSCSAVG